MFLQLLSNNAMVNYLQNVQYIDLYVKITLKYNDCAIVMQT